MVLLSVLGNHQGAGFANFTSFAQADAFAAQLADAVTTYGLDGIDFDDEVWLNDRARGTILYRDDRKRELQVHAMEILEHRPISPTIGLCANFDM